MLTSFINKVKSQFNKMVARKAKHGRKVIPTEVVVTWDAEEKELNIDFLYESETYATQHNVLSMACDDEMNQEGLIETFNQTLFGNPRTTWRQFDALYDSFIDELAENQVTPKERYNTTIIGQILAEETIAARAVEPEPEVEVTPIVVEIEAVEPMTIADEMAKLSAKVEEVIEELETKPVVEVLQERGIERLIETEKANDIQSVADNGLAINREIEKLNAKREMFNVAKERCYDEGHKIFKMDFNKSLFIIDSNSSGFIDEIKAMLQPHSFTVMSKTWYEMGF